MSFRWTEKDSEHFVRGYMICALWSSTDESTPSGGEPLDANYDISDIAADSKKKMKRDCAKFIKENRIDLIEYLEKRDSEDAGHDFWLTRNGHGAGFWDRGMGALGEHLSKASKKFGECYLYVGDDKKIHVG